MQEENGRTFRKQETYMYKLKQPNLQPHYPHNMLQTFKDLRFSQSIVPNAQSNSFQSLFDISQLIMPNARTNTFQSWFDTRLLTKSDWRFVYRNYRQTFIFLCDLILCSLTKITLLLILFFTPNVQSKSFQSLNYMFFRTSALLYCIAYEILPNPVNSRLSGNLLTVPY